MNGFPEASSPWFQMFWIGCYLSALGCFAFGVNRGHHHGWRAGLGQVVLFAFLVGFYFLLESFGEVRIPFYVYFPDYPDWLTPIHYPAFLVPDFSARPLVRACQKLVTEYEPRLPVSIPLMEASLTYAALWTARFLGVRPILQPMVGGLAPLLADSVIDPILTTSFNCPQAGESPHLVSGSFGLWKWHALPDGDRDALGPDWFGIPLINYAIWFAGPVMMMALINLGGTALTAWKAGTWRTTFAFRRLHWPSQSETFSALAIVVCVATVVVVCVSPDLTRLPPPIQRGLFYGTVTLCFGYFVRGVMDAERGERVHVGIVLPQLFFLVFPVAYLLGSGLFRPQPELLLTAAVFVPLGMLFCWSPYGAVISTYRRVVSSLDGYLRLRYLSYSSLMLFLGAASTAAEPSTPVLIGLLLVALGFNTHSFLVNDVFDLPVDRTQPRRQQDPQVRGDIPREWSVTIALALVPFLFLVTWTLGGGAGAHIALSAAFVFMAIYNFWGKRFAFPPVTDLIQGLAWGSLAIYGAELAGHRTTSMSWLVGAYGAGFMFLINGVHGGLRDLENDLRHDQRTTAIYFGAQPDGRGGAVGTRRLRVFAHVAHAALLVLSMLVLYVGWGTTDWLVRIMLPLTIAAGVASVFINQKVAAERADGRDFFVSLHLLVALLPLLLVAMPMLSPLMRVVVALTFFGSLMFVQPVLFLRDHFGGRGSPDSPSSDRGQRPASYPAELDARLG